MKKIEQNCQVYFYFFLNFTTDKSSSPWLASPIAAREISKFKTNLKMMLPFPKLKAINYDNEEKQVIIWILHSHLHAGWGTPFGSRQNEPANRRKQYDVPYITYGPFQPVMEGQRMLPIYAMYSISEKNSAVTFLINKTPSGKWEVCLHSNKKSLVIEMNRKKIPLHSRFLSSGWNLITT